WGRRGRAGACGGEGAGLARRRRIAALTGFALVSLGLTWMTATSAFGAATAVYALSAALPLSAAACAWSAVGVAREGRPWSWIAVAMNGLLAVGLAERWGAYIGVPVGVLGGSLALSRVNLEFLAFSAA